MGATYCGERWGDEYRERQPPCEIMRPTAPAAVQPLPYRWSVTHCGTLLRPRRRPWRCDSLTVAVQSLPDCRGPDSIGRAVGTGILLRGIIVH